jgi:hypothetical protein
MDLRVFSNYIANNVSVYNGLGYAYVAETQTGAMIASTIPNSVVNSSGIRQFAPNQTFAYAVANPNTIDG